MFRKEWRLVRSQRAIGRVDLGLNESTVVGISNKKE